MAVKTNAAYFGTTGKLEIGTGGTTDDYTAAVSSFALTPTAPATQITDIGGGVQSLVGANMWKADIGYRQDWTTVDSLSQKLIEWHGQIKTFKYTPAAGGKTVTVTALVQAGTIGGANSAVHEATVSLQVNGQPVLA